MQLLEQAEHAEPPEEHEKFRAACGTVFVDLGQSLLYPIYRRHEELVPDDLKGDLL